MIENSSESLYSNLQLLFVASAFADDLKHNRALTQIYILM